MTIAVIGANGYIGSALCSALYALNCQIEEYDKLIYVIPITRDSYQKASKQSYTIVINCAMPSKRYWANQNPDQDFIETVEKTRDIATQWRYDKLIQISSISARCDPTSVYGKHKLEAEKICQSIHNSLIYRLTSTYGPGLTKGILTDILKGKVYVSSESRYAFSSLGFVAGWIAGHLDRTGIVELGARNTINLQEIVDCLKINVEFERRIENQEVNNPEPDFPDAREVLDFMKAKVAGCC